MLAFLRDYIIYLWNVLFKQTRPASAALTSTEGTKGSTDTSTTSASTSFPIASADTKDKVEEPKPEAPKPQTPPKEKAEEPRPEPPNVTTTCTRDRAEEPRPVLPEPPASTKNRAEEPKPEPPKVPVVSTPVAEAGKVDSTSPQPPKPVSTKPSVKPADLSYSSAPLAQQEKRIPPEPSRPPPSLSEPKIVCNAVPPLAATKQVPPPFEVKAAPTSVKSESVAPPSPPQQQPQQPPKPSLQESRPAPAKLAPTPPQPSAVESIPNKENGNVVSKPVQPIAQPPRVEEVLLKPKIVQEVKREAPVTVESKDFDDEDEYEYEEEEVEVEEEDIDDYKDHLATDTKAHLPPVHQPQQVRAPLKVEDYDSEDDIITDIDRSCKYLKMSKEENASNNTALVTMPEDMPQLPNLQGKVGGASVKAKEEQSSVSEMHKTASKDEGDKHIEQKTDIIQKQDSAKTAKATIKTTNEGGVTRTVATTVVTSSSSFEEEEVMEEKITPKAKSITQK